MEISYRVKWYEDSSSYSKKNLPFSVYKHIFGTISEHVGWSEILVAAFATKELSDMFVDFMNAKEVKNAKNR